MITCSITSAPSGSSGREGIRSLWPDPEIKFIFSDGWYLNTDYRLDAESIVSDLQLMVETKIKDA